MNINSFYEIIYTVRGCILFLICTVYRRKNYAIFMWLLYSFLFICRMKTDQNIICTCAYPTNVLDGRTNVAVRRTWLRTTKGGIVQWVKNITELLLKMWTKIITNTSTLKLATRICYANSINIHKYMFLFSKSEHFFYYTK